MRKIKKLRKGFTLVELVVVIAVIAILAGVSVGAYFGITDSANSSNASVAQKQVKDYWTMYSIEEYEKQVDKSEDNIGTDFILRYLPFMGYTVKSISAPVQWSDSLLPSGLRKKHNGEHKPDWHLHSR